MSKELPSDGGRAAEQQREAPLLRNDPTIPPALREHLRAATQAGAEYDVAAGLARFEQPPRLGTGGGGGAAAGAGAGGKTVLGAALKGALLGVAVVGGYSAFEDRSLPPASVAPIAGVVAPTATAGGERQTRKLPTTAETRPRPGALEVAKPPDQVPVPSSTGVAVPAPAETALPMEPAISPVPSPAVTSTPSPAANKLDRLAAEVEHTARLRAIQDSDPAAALALTVDGNQRFPGGLFTQEREAIAIGALARVGRRDEARTRARAFLATHPRSSFAEKLTAIAGPP